MLDMRIGIVNCKSVNKQQQIQLAYNSLKKHIMIY